MSAEFLSRRQMLKSGACVAVGTTIATLVRPVSAAAQQPANEPLHDDRVTLVTTTEKAVWQQGTPLKPTFSWEQLNLNIDPEQIRERAQPVLGFGGCFNELGWRSLQALEKQDQENILHELFDPQAGARFNYCRMPIGANDFSTAAYSYDENDGDFALKNFSIDHDKSTLIPFIHAAQKYQPHLRLWASPWTPPSWMKRNHFYAEAKSWPGMPDNGIRSDQIGHEGEDFFIQEPRYFEAYARYFGRFIDAYRAEGIDVGMVMPQNEFNSAQNFPSCTWTPVGLTRFLRSLAPEMLKRGVDIFFGTLERGDPQLLDAILTDKDIARAIKGVGVQWAGKNALPKIHDKHPDLLIYQSEQECGDGANTWAYTGYCWQLMKHYFRNGASAYMYWNISLEMNTPSTWGWAQNSLVSVDPVAKTYRFNHDYYLMKHLTHYVDLGAKSLETAGTCDNALAFVNPDGSVVVLLRNESSLAQKVQVRVRNREVTVELPPDSIATLFEKAS